MDTQTVFAPGGLPCAVLHHSIAPTFLSSPPMGLLPLTSALAGIAFLLPSTVKKCGKDSRFGGRSQAQR